MKKSAQRRPQHNQHQPHPPPQSHTGPAADPLPGAKPNRPPAAATAGGGGNISPIAARILNEQRQHQNQHHHRHGFSYDPSHHAVPRAPAPSPLDRSAAAGPPSPSSSSPSPSPSPPPPPGVAPSSPATSDVSPYLAPPPAVSSLQEHQYDGGGGGGGAVARLAPTPPTISRLSLVPAPAPASPREEQLVTHGFVTHGSSGPGSPIAGIASSAPARGLTARISDVGSGGSGGAAAPSWSPSPLYTASAAAGGSGDAGHGHGVSAAGLHQLLKAVWVLGRRIFGPLMAVVRERPLAAAAMAALVLPAAVLLASGMAVELLLMPLISMPGLIVSFVISFVMAMAASLSYRRNRVAAARRHAALGLLYTAGTQLPATSQLSQPQAQPPQRSRPSQSSKPSGPAPVPAAAAAAGAADASSTLTLVDDAGLAALRFLYGGGALPARLADARHGERAEWVNALLARVWPAVEGPLRGLIGPAIHAQADLAKPPFIRSVGLADLSLGETPPRVEAVRVRPLASAAAQAEAVAAVAAAVAAADAAAAAAEPPDDASAAAGEFTFDTRPLDSTTAPSIAAASVSPAAATVAPGGGSGGGGGSTAAAPTAGVVLSGVSDATMSAMAAVVAVQEHVTGSGTAAAASAPAAEAPGTDGGGGGGVEAIEVEVDFQWQGDPTIGLFVEAYLTPGGGTVRLTPRLKELAVAGTVRLVLTPLVPYPPGFGAIQVSMPRAPQLSFSFDLGPGALGAGGGVVTGPVAAFLQPLLQDIVGEALVWPERVVVAVLPERLTGPLTDLQLRTRGLLAVRLLEVRGPPPPLTPVAPPAKKGEGAGAGEGEAAAAEEEGGGNMLRDGAEVEITAFTRPDRRVTTPLATCHYAAAAADGAAAAMPVCTWGDGDGSGGARTAKAAAASPPLLYLPVQEPRSDLLRLQLTERVGLNLGPGSSVTAWLPLHPPGEGGGEEGPVVKSTARTAAGEGGQGGGGGPADREMHRGRVAGRPQLMTVGEEGAAGGGGGGSGDGGDEAWGGFGAGGQRATVWAVPADVGQVPTSAAAAAFDGTSLAATPQSLSAALPPQPPPPHRARGGAVLAVLSYLSVEVLSERLAAAVAESLRTTGMLPFVRGLLVVDVVSARWLLGPDAYPPEEKPAAADAAARRMATAMYGGGGGDDDESLSDFSDEDSDEDEEGETEAGASVRHQKQKQAEVAAAVDAAARIIESDAPLTFGSQEPGGAGSLHANPAAARVVGAAAHLGPAGAAGGLALRNRHGRIRCDPYVQIEVTRPVVAPLAGAEPAAATAAEPITAEGDATGGGGGVAPYILRGPPVPASVDPSFGLHGEVDGVVPAAEGAELRVQLSPSHWLCQRSRICRTAGISPQSPSKRVLRSGKEYPTPSAAALEEAAAGDSMTRSSQKEPSLDEIYKLLQTHSTQTKASFDPLHGKTDALAAHVNSLEKNIPEMITKKPARLGPGSASTGLLSYMQLKPWQGHGLGRLPGLHRTELHVPSLLELTTCRGEVIPEDDADGLKGLTVSEKHAADRGVTPMVMFAYFDAEEGCLEASSTGIGDGLGDGFRCLLGGRESRDAKRDQGAGIVVGSFAGQVPALFRPGAVGRTRRGPPELRLHSFDDELRGPNFELLDFGLHLFGNHFRDILFQRVNTSSQRICLAMQGIEGRLGLRRVGLEQLVYLI
ncbi:hypothetical protein VOLCADRAFT_89131 [Volvox carteri f. nagariensis]|uniref:SMP-LTD domain-containing protein n=1 Tax=Volvox carteri f. nagariensis TaxID=3068 RepID=D8TQV8_VOLCA|nr:uncharacterized protein VOLCADRAFT_89131 [Volvox carteri f. nagariensis]EFJ50223.1 hypothetical protein VOLCADRAFT_89131 [Volvox carteri f. nagariensis]|eukprot:XP_002948843.1 hypothetical protein VOLCADRAFT_89131 [Volvox carteri f. nagariensis]